MCAGVDAHIGITDIAYCSFNRSGGKVYYNFVPDLIDDLFFGNQINGCGLLFFVQFSDVRKMLIAENGQSVFRQLHVLQADGFERKINVFHPKIPAIQLDDAADWQIIRFPKIFCLVVGAIFVQASQIDVVARCPQLLDSAAHCSLGKPVTLTLPSTFSCDRRLVRRIRSTATASLS